MCSRPCPCTCPVKTAHLLCRAPRAPAEGPWEKRRCPRPVRVRFFGFHRAARARSASAAVPPCWGTWPSHARVWRPLPGWVAPPPTARRLVLVSCSGRFGLALQHCGAREAVCLNVLWEGAGNLPGFRWDLAVLGNYTQVGRARMFARAGSGVDVVRPSAGWRGGRSAVE
eukprot:gene18935-biopygen16012